MFISNSLLETKKVKDIYINAPGTNNYRLILGSYTPAWTKVLPARSSTTTINGVVYRVKGIVGELGTMTTGSILYKESDIYKNSDDNYWTNVNTYSYILLIGKRVYEVVSSNNLSYWYGGPYYKNDILQTDLPFMDTTFLTKTQYSIITGSQNISNNTYAFYYQYDRNEGNNITGWSLRIDKASDNEYPSIRLGTQDNKVVLKVYPGNDSSTSFTLDTGVEYGTSNPQINLVKLWGYPYGSTIKLDLMINYSTNLNYIGTLDLSKISGSPSSNFLNTLTFAWRSYSADNHQTNYFYKISLN